MPDAEKDAAAAEVAARRQAFDLELTDRRKYPMLEFRAFVQSARRYIVMTKDDPLIHRSVVQAVNGLREYLAAERKRVPGDVLFEADRLECLFFAGSDPPIEGDGAPGVMRGGLFFNSRRITSTASGFSGPLSRYPAAFPTVMTR
ncbi:MAG: hypothetical protein ACP5M4_15075 [Acidobacteriaceae bacterium]